MSDQTKLKVILMSLLSGLYVFSMVLNFFMMKDLVQFEGTIDGFESLGFGHLMYKIFDHKKGGDNEKPNHKD